MKTKQQKKQIIEIIKNKLRSGDYDKDKLEQLFPSHLNEAILNESNVKSITKLIIGLDLQQEINNEGLYNYYRYDWDNSIIPIPKSNYKWREVW